MIRATTIRIRISGASSHSHHSFLPLLLELLVPAVELWPTVVVTAPLVPLPPEVLLTPPVLLTDPPVPDPLVVLPPDVLLTPPLLLTVPLVLPLLEPVLDVELELRPPLLEVELELVLTPPLLLPPLLTPPDARPGTAATRTPPSARPCAVVPSEPAERPVRFGAESAAAYAVPADPASKVHNSNADMPTRMLSPVVVDARASMTGTRMADNTSPHGLIACGSVR